MSEEKYFSILISNKNKLWWWERMQRGRPTRDKQNKIKKILQPYYQQGISASAASKVTQLNIKTVLKYFAD